MEVIEFLNCVRKNNFDGKGLYMEDGKMGTVYMDWFELDYV